MSLFTTMGMFIIDENRYIDPPAPSQTDIIGGAGTYAIMGARIVTELNNSHLISGIIDKGIDFPSTVYAELQSWSTGIIFRDSDRLTTRGCNIYDKGIRFFEYLSPKKQIEVNDIIQYENLKRSKTYHLICSIDRCNSIIKDILKFNPEAIFIYEPLPTDCIHENYTKLTKLLPYIHIFSPNLDEAEGLAGKSNLLKELAIRFTKYQSIPNSGTVIRCGSEGCFIHTTNNGTYKLPAYHQDQSKVVDVTGGGNSFLGSFAMGWILNDQNWLTAGIYGNVGSGCVIEKLGMPTVIDDKFNGISFKDRLTKYLTENQIVIH
ncbi:MAK32 [Candida pseudojiufengensis]|uniref:MAK32 n=1 Tax=Candida pseudojiufengensis TaxID=497109 RepID=UPI0022259422|nr:MAK32 [Candida pseudojiufengensis]KAI5966238.1 MAK32 [Candida pseudojiufengensis]